MIKSLVLLMFSMFLVSSCSKYDDGPLVSLQSREARVANVWKVEKASDLNGADVTATFNQKKWELTDKFSVIYHENQTKYFGRWQFTQSNDNLEMVFDSLPPQTFMIKLLKDKEMTLKNRATDITINFVPVD